MMINIKLRKVLIFIIIFLLTTCFLFEFNKLPAWAAGKILLLHSYNNGYSWTDGVNNGFINEIQSHPDITCTIDYLDLKRNVDEVYVNKLVELLKIKYTGKKYNVIVVSDDPGFELLMTLRNELFPNTPIVFCGLNNFDPNRARQLGNMTGIIEEVSIKETIDLIKVLHPDRDKIIWIGNDFSKTEKINYEIFKNYIQRYKPNFKFEFWLNYKDTEIIEKLKKNQNKSVFFTALLLKTNKGEILSAESSTKLVCKNTDCPVYTLWDLHLGQGVVGGKVVSSKNQGKIAAQMALDIIYGKEVTEIPIHTSKEANCFMFDYNALKKHNINQNLLPANSIIINQPFSFYKAYKHYIWTTIIIFILLIIIILSLHIIIQIRKKSYKVLQEQKDFLKTMLINLPIDFWARDANGIVIAQSEYSKKLWGDYLGTTLDDFKQASMYSKELCEAIKLAYKGETSYIDRVLDIKGETYYFYTVIAPIVSNNKIIGIIGINQDLTNIKQAELEIKRKSEELAKLNKDLENKILETQQLNNSLRQSQAELLISYKTIRESEKRFKSLIDNMSEGFATVNQNGLFVFSNPAADYIFDCNLGDLISQNLSRYFSIEDCEAILSVANNGDKKSKHMVTTITTHRQETKTLLLSIAPNLIDTSEEPSVNILFVDITDRITAEKIAYENEKKLQAIITQLKAQIWTTDENLVLTYFLASTSQTKSELFTTILYKNINEILPKDEYYNELLQAHINALKGQSYFKTLRVKDYTFDFYIEPYKDVKDNIIGVIGIAFDTTELTQVREQLAAIDIQLKQAQEISSIGSWIYDVKNNHAICSDNLYEILGLDKQKKIKVEDMIAMLPNEDIAKLNNDLYQLLTKEKLETYIEYRLKTPSGKVIDVLLKGRSIINDKGEVEKIIGSFQDITERKRLEEERIKIRNLETLSSLAGGIAHDFNNYLTVIGNHADEILNELNNFTNSNKESIIESLKTIKRFVTISTGLTQQLLTFAKGSKPVKKLINLSELLIKAAQFAVHGTNLQLEFDIPKDYYINGDENQIGGQVVNNLIINARQANATKFKISARSLVNPENNLPYVEITFTDNGVGIDKTIAKRIFDPYFTTKHDGSGLGLSICQNIISSHDGDIYLQDTSSSGTTFVCILPLVKETERSSEIAEEKFEQLSPKKILILDDEATVREVLTRMITKLGHEVIVATNEIEAVEKYKKAYEAGEPPDLCILDLTLVGSSATGEDVLFEIRKINPQAKIVISSGYAQEPENDYGEKYNTFLNKPYYIEDLAKIISRLLSSN